MTSAGCWGKVTLQQTVKYVDTTVSPISISDIVIVRTSCGPPVSWGQGMLSQRSSGRIVKLTTKCLYVILSCALFPSSCLFMARSLTKHKKSDRWTYSGRNNYTDLTCEFDVLRDWRTVTSEPCGLLNQQTRASYSRSRVAGGTCSTRGFDGQNGVSRLFFFSRTSAQLGYPWPTVIYAVP